MTAAKYHTSRPDHWVSPRPTRDPMGNKYSPLQPMPTERVGFLRRLFGRVGHG